MDNRNPLTALSQWHGRNPCLEEVKSMSSLHAVVKIIRQLLGLYYEGTEANLNDKQNVLAKLEKMRGLNFDSGSGSVIAYKELASNNYLGVITFYKGDGTVIVSDLVAFSRVPSLHVGTRLIEAAVAYSLECNYGGKVTLTSNSRAIGFYEKLGFSGDGGTFILEPKNKRNLWAWSKLKKTFVFNCYEPLVNDESSAASTASVSKKLYKCCILM